MYIQADPYKHTKHDLAIMGKEVLAAFCKLNNISCPKILFFTPKGGGPTSRGYFNGNIMISTKLRPPVKTPGYSWSFTGYKADVTAPGVMAHELGHWIHIVKGVRKVQTLFVPYTYGEAPVTSYEPTVNEAFAEATRLFILNPTLLQVGRPLRYNFLTQRLGLKPLHQEPWQYILKYADAHILTAAFGWIEKGNKAYKAKRPS